MPFQRPSDRGIRSVVALTIRPPEKAVSASATKSQSPTEAYAQFLASTFIFQGLPQAFLMQIAAACEYRQFNEGESLISAGDVPGIIGFIAAGRFGTLLSSSRDDAVPGEILDIGDSCGEEAFLTGEPADHTLFAIGQAGAFIVRREVFEKVLQAAPAIYGRMAQAVASRLTRLRSVVANTPNSGQFAQNGATQQLVLADRVDDGNVIPFVDLSGFKLSSNLSQLMPARMITEHRMLPLQCEGDVVTVGMVNPKSGRARNDVAQVLRGYKVRLVAISADDYVIGFSRLRIDLADRAAQANNSSATKSRIDYLALQKKEAEKQQLVIGDEAAKAFDRILYDAVQAESSDIHIEPEPNAVRVRYRVNGVLVERKEVIPASMANALIGRIKVLAELDVTERRLPQDGRIVAMIGKREINLRISTLATARGEKVVIRILDPANVFRPLEQVYVLPKMVELVRLALSLPHGAVIVGGATGSGKSSSLYAMFNERRKESPGANYVTVEDPVEYVLQGVTQIPIQAKIGLDFTTVLRSLLRQDPDVIMVTELRDADTARLTISAALTGHIVLTTIHANNAATLLQRLEFLGSDRLMLSQAVNLAIAQKLVKRLCSRCATSEEMPNHVRANFKTRGIEISAENMFVPVGCVDCNHTGYDGRIAVAEVMSFNAELRNEYEAHGVTPELLVKAQNQGYFIPFSVSVSRMVEAGLISTAEALMVIVT